MKMLWLGLILTASQVCAAESLTCGNIDGKLAALWDGPRLSIGENMFPMYEYNRNSSGVYYISTDGQYILAEYAFSKFVYTRELKVLGECKKYRPTPYPKDFWWGPNPYPGSYYY